MSKVLCVLSLVFLLNVAPLRAQCDGDAGFTLTTAPETVGIAGVVRFHLDTPWPATATWLFSLGEGPIESPFGELCLDLPPVLNLAVPISNSGTTIEMVVPCDEALAGIEIYHQFIAIQTGGEGRGLSNQSRMRVSSEAGFCGDFPDFNDVSELTINGAAAVVDGVLRITPATTSQAGSFFVTEPASFSPDTSFKTQFVFRVHGSGDGADGMTFMIQGHDPTVIGSGGGGLGYQGIDASVAVEIDNYPGGYDADANHVGILSDGTVEIHHDAHSPPGLDLEDEVSHTIWVEYDGFSDRLDVYLSADVGGPRPDEPVMTAVLDLFALIGSTGYLGFSAGTGGAVNNHDVESWSYWVGEFQ